MHQKRKQSLQSTSPEKPESMDVERVLHMKEGLGDTSYALNSTLQKKNLGNLKHIIIKSAIDFYDSETPKTLLLADLGCSSGPNALSTVKSIIEEINKNCRKASKASPEFMVFLNDLPTNDFNTIFVGVPEFVKKIKGCDGPSVFVFGVPGSFYGRLFPSSSLHFITSCYSLHWLSQVPLGLFDEQGKSINKGKMYISHTSPNAVAESYFQQFEKDFGLFLTSRSEEIIKGGGMAFVMLGRKTDDRGDRNTIFLWELLAQSFAIMVSQGLVQEEKVDSYNVPFYAPSMKEIEDAVTNEGSFVIAHMDVFELNTTTGKVKEDAASISMAVRAIQESMIANHFGEGIIIDTLFQNFRELLSESLEKEQINGNHLVVILKKLQ